MVAASRTGYVLVIGGDLLHALLGWLLAAVSRIRSWDGRLAPVDFGLLEVAISDSGLWDRFREAVWRVDFSRITGPFVGEEAAEACFREIKQRRHLQRHHALADALALRAA